MFLQPDWFEVQKPGVGTNRFSYSFNDPVNFSDPSRNGIFESVRDFFSSPARTKASAEHNMSQIQTNIDDVVDSYDAGDIDASTASDRLSVLDTQIGEQQARFNNADSQLRELGAVALDSVGLAIVGMAVKSPARGASLLTAEGGALLGAYSKAGGHHIHQAAAFRGASGYSAQGALSISDEALSAAGAMRPHIGSDSITSFQRQLQTGLARSGRQITMAEQTRIAQATLEFAGVPPKLARELAFRSELNLIFQGVTSPSRIPFH